MWITARWAQRSAGALAALIIAAGLIAALGGRAEAQIDLSGDWIVTLSGDRSDTCKGTYNQSGSSLSTNMECEAFGTVVQTGTIDPETGSFELTGEITNDLGTVYQVEVLGTASPDGNAMGGTWSTSTGTEDLSGTFAGTRQPAPETPTATEQAEDEPTPTDEADVSGLPETGASRPASSVSLEFLLLLAGGGAALALGGLYARLRSRPQDIPG